MDDGHFWEGQRSPGAEAEGASGAQEWQQGKDGLEMLIA